MSLTLLLIKTVSKRELHPCSEGGVFLHGLVIKGCFFEVIVLNLVCKIEFKMSIGDVYNV
jgi:hypothetical protein